jgi:glucuronate isomerase
MYRRVLAETLADDAVRGLGWPVDRALALARLVLLENPRRIFRREEPGHPPTARPSS